MKYDSIPSSTPILQKSSDRIPISQLVINFAAQPFLYNSSHRLLCSFLDPPYQNLCVLGPGYCLTFVNEGRGVVEMGFVRWSCQDCRFTVVFLDHIENNFQTSDPAFRGLNCGSSGILFLSSHIMIQCDSYILQLISTRRCIYISSSKGTR